MGGAGLGVVPPLVTTKVGGAGGGWACEVRVTGCKMAVCNGMCWPVTCMA